MVREVISFHDMKKKSPVHLLGCTSVLFLEEPLFVDILIEDSGEPVHCVPNPSWEAWNWSIRSKFYKPSAARFRTYHQVSILTSGHLMVKH